MFAGGAGMTQLTAAQWQRAMALFDNALDGPRDDYAAHLASIESDPAVRAEVESLLAATNETRGFFDRTPRVDSLTAIPEMPAGTRVGSWRIVRTIGHGGMGAVYEAARADGGFDQRAALKIIGVEASAYLTRFEDERAIVARLEHPGIARLYDGGLDSDGHPFMAMEYVDGTIITIAAQEAALDLAARLKLFADVCDAVAYAHRHLVVHLDIKPGNVMVTHDGQARLLDFGAARVLQVGLPQGEAAAMLTPIYAAPEQLAHAPVTTATDVYALGALLYELLVGSLPWSRDDTPANRRILPSESFRQAPSPIAAASMAGDIDAIVSRAMSPDAAARYANAGVLGAEIRRHLAGEPIAARATSRIYVAGRTARRYRWAVAAVALLLISLAGGVVATAIQAHRAIVERDHFEAEVERNNAALDYFTLMMRTAGEGNGGRPVTTQAVLNKSVANLDRNFANDPPLYGRVVELLSNLYAELTDSNGGVALQQHYLGLPVAKSDPVSAARIRLLLAQSLLRQGDSSGAQAALAPAQRFWSADSSAYVGDLARSRIVEAQIDKANQDFHGAIATLRAGLVEAAEPGAGISREDVSNLQNSLALALLVDGSFDEADRLMTMVRAYRQQQGRSDDNLLTAIQNQGAIALGRGDLPRAERLLRQSIVVRRAAFGNSGALAAAENNLARTLLLEDRPSDARTAARDAAAIGLRFAGAKSPLTVGGDVLIAAADAELQSPEATTSATLARNATAAKPDALHALSLAVDARNAANAGHQDVARTDVVRGKQLLAAIGRPALLTWPLYARIASGHAVSSR